MGMNMADKANNVGLLKPTGITLNRETHTLNVTWQDGHESIFPLNALREACPCAVCRGGHENMGRDHDPNIIDLKPARSYTVENLQIIGKYALQVFWSDGHSSGIYTWDYLRRICPCEECQAARRAG